MKPRPDSLAEVAGRAIATGSFEFELAEFLHEYARRGEVEMLRETPTLLRDCFPLGGVYDAYLAAVAVLLGAGRGYAAPR